MLKFLVIIYLFFFCDCRSLRVKRVAYNDPTALWPNKTIFYSIDGKYEDEMVEMIRSGIEEWKAYTCLEFIDCEDYCEDLDHYAYFTSLDGCYSYVGFVETLKKQIVSLHERSCASRRIVLHEIGHLIGLHHEHKRPDRDKYIKIYEKNIDKAKFKVNFGKLNKSKIHFLLPYDYNSIMHYSNDGFSINGKETFKILKNIKNKNMVGNLEKLSKLNIYEVNQLYDCD